jgi:5-methylcytosine-specific restriction endonuclease McrA
VVKKIGENPICYLTGKSINLDHPETYNLDHIIPASRGGTNDLENLGICLKEANQAKGDLLLEELYDLCDSILSWRNKCQN